MKPSKRTLQTRRTEKERAELVERFKHSGLTRVAFARQNGVALSTLGHWLTQEKSRSKLPLVRDGHFQKLTPSLHSPVVFGEVELTSLFSAPSAEWAMELVNARGFTIRCREALSASDLERLLRRC